MQDLFAGQANFNSIKVQLKLVIGFIAFFNLIFQFHKGTIKTFADEDAPEGKVISIP